MVQKEELKKIICSALSSGISRKELENFLAEFGWPQEMVHEYINIDCDNLPIIYVRGVSKSFGKHQVLQDVTFHINKGEILGIIGASGVGKTTLLNIIVGFVQPDSGEIVLNIPHKPGWGGSRDVKRMFGFAAQTPSFYPHLTARENIEHFAALYGFTKAERRLRAESLLKLVGLSDFAELLASQLSGGMQKRLDIACALVHNPPILILDEPVADIDLLLRQQMWNLIKAINKRGTTVIIASHFLLELESLCTRIALLHKKKITQIGSPPELSSALLKKHRMTLELASRNYTQLFSELARDPKLKCQFFIQEGKAVLLTESPEELLHALVHILERS
ncbi:MAG: ABC transporter ATP-binding protein, partial [Candidatus Woesearchaeota archaeon]